MSHRAKVGLAVGFLLSVALVGVGCSTTIDGNPVASDTSANEPSFPTTRPTRTPPSTGTTPSTPPTGTHPGGETLPPDESGYVFIETKSGKTRCQISREEVGCESDFNNAIEVHGMPANGVRVTAGGSMEWVVGNLGNIPAVTLDYQTYHALGWTIEATSDGTRFTNDGTGHGMFINTSGVEVF
ncbi:hypothetical protein BST36_13755 [Mycolicibacterium moriokaense]|jgi:hypothetical protein|uniref:Lipoprotein LpqJ n=1 Tax=Mycolicibacterium moriokaense TaxID=39691 RepID=A0AAD1HGN6_9MYCO|nr:hypothetical protein [Mycolicibacterium moriokaense]MCV7042354.1 hypothetical protein [Mycolicibacterium moriokaense]ORB23035.1 hypothetical protein BST36_13755 [Mycolicibacterium moriokaense]BBX05127.1 hypothetical protein MMOR_60630 [Mycolicibacterium moriokaense]